MQPTAIVLHGPTSAGKTTLAKALQAASPVPAFHVSLDAFVTMSNRRNMRSDEERAADPVYKRRYDLMLDTSKTTPEAGAGAVRKLVSEGSRPTAG